MKTWVLKFRKTDMERFEELRCGIKEIETRAATVKYRSIVAGDTIKFVCGNNHFLKTINKKHHWKNVEEMTKKIPFKKIMPNARSFGEMKRIYASYPGYTEKIKKFGIFGFEFE